MTILNPLSKKERKKYDSPPNFSANDRALYLSFDSDAMKVVDRSRNKTNSVGFLLPHYHIIALDGVFLTHSKYPNPIFKQVSKPTALEIQQVLDNISIKVAIRLEKLGFIERDMDNYYLALDEHRHNDHDELSGYSTTYRVAVGPNQGKKVFTLGVRGASLVFQYES